MLTDKRSLAGSAAKAACSSGRRAFSAYPCGRKQQSGAQHKCLSALAQSVASAAVVGPSSEALNKLAGWCKTKGANTDKLAISSSLTTGQGILTAAKDISAGEAVLTLGEGAWLSLEVVRKSSIGKAVEGLEPWLQIALFLVLTRHQSQASSEWAPYLATVPTRPATPLFWTEAQQSMLQGTQVMDSMQGYRAFFDFKYQELFGPQGSLAGQAAVFPPDVFTYDKFLAAVATVRCRAHAPLEEGQLSLVPLADAVSHKRQGNTCWKVKPAGLFGKGQQLVVEATRAIRKGEELSMDYAPEKLDNITLLDYGVVDADNPRPGYSLTLSIAESDKLRDDKLDVVDNTAGLSSSMTFNLAPATEPETTMMGLLRLINLKGADVFLLEPVFSQQVWDFMCEPVSPDNEQAVCNSMIEGAKAALSRYAGSIEADLAALRTGSFAAGSPEEAAIRVRLGEREALDGLQQWFEERAAGLKRLEYYQERRLRRLGLIDDEGRTTYDSFFKGGIA